MRFDTKLVRAGQDPVPGTGDIVPPIHMSVAYARSEQDPVRYFYARGENPTRERLEECLAALEDARHASVFATGQAAAMAVLSAVEPGGIVLASDDVYGGTHALFELVRRYDIAVNPVDFADPDAVTAALSGRAANGVRMVWLETPTNPLLKISDIARIAELARRRDILVVVDNTLASPVLQQPLRLGADVTLYSTTKFVAGHLDVLGGALVYDRDDLHGQFTGFRTTTGGVPGGLDCFLLHRGLKTMSLRVDRQVRTAGMLADALLAERSVAQVRYPGLPSHPGHEVAARQMSAPGALISFEYTGDPHALLTSTRLFSAAVSLGGVASLIEHPASMTHHPVPAPVRARLGVTDRLIRLSIGIEDPADLVADLIRAVRAAARGARVRPA